MRLTYALIFYRLGVPVLPCYGRSKAILQGFGIHQPNFPDERFLYNWLINLDNNYALVTGHDGLVVLDFDDQEIYQYWAGQAGKFALSYTVATARGYHVYFRADDLRSWKAEGVEVMGKGKAVMGAYSLHPDGFVYQPVNAPAIMKIESVTDFFFLSDHRPELSEPPKILQDPSRKARQGSDAISKIKAAWPILRSLELLFPECYASLKGQGRWIHGLCPFHDDHQASFWIDQQRGLFGCHACDAHGDVINLVALRYEISSSRAVSRILQDGSVVLHQGVK